MPRHRPGAGPGSARRKPIPALTAACFLALLAPTQERALGQEPSGTPPPAPVAVDPALPASEPSASATAQMASGRTPQSGKKAGPGGIPQELIAGVRKDEIMFPVAAFDGSKVGDSFAVLTQDRKGVQAYLEVNSIVVHKGLPWAKCTARELAPGLKLALLAKAPVVRASDAKRKAELLTAGPLPATGPGGSAPPLPAPPNPTLGIWFLFRSGLFTAANVISGAALDPVVTSLGSRIEAALPPFKAAPWLNAFGLRADALLLRKTSIIARSALGAPAQSTALSGSRWEGALAFRPRLPWRFLSRAVFEIVPLREETDVLNLSAAGNDPGGVIEIKRRGLDLRAGLEMAPVTNASFGALFGIPLPHPFEASDTPTGGGAGRSEKGKWSSFTADLWGALRLPLLQRPAADGGLWLAVEGHAIYRHDKVTAPELTQGKARSDTDWGTGLALGIAWAR